MKIFMDTANVEEIKQYVDWGVVYGVTRSEEHTSELQSRI